MTQTLAASSVLPSQQTDRANALPVAIFLILALVPFGAAFGPESYVLGLFTRVMVFAVAALALDFICGYGGLVSFGHAAFVGIGAYAVGILGAHGVTEMLVIPSGRAIGRRDLRLPDWNGMSADEERVLHHDHAGFRANGVFYCRLARALRRR